MDFLTSSKKLLQTLAFTATFAISSTAQAGLIFDEADLGDFDDGWLNPVTLAFAEGTNQVLGESIFRDFGPGPATTDFDSFLFKVADGFSLTAIRFRAIAEAPKDVLLNAGFYLHKYDAVNTWGEELGVAQIDVLKMSVQEMFTKSMPLPAGVYGFFNGSFSKNFEGRRWQYRIEFDVVSNNPAPVNAPGTLLLLSGVFGLLAWRRRQQ